MTSSRPASSFEVPVLILGHARPATTAQVIESLRSVSPERVYLAVDGARSEVEGETEKVRLVQESMMEGIDWPCRVETMFREENLGIREGITESITWFFENEEMGIILEDDCLPDSSFFPYCEELLEKYRDDERVMHIGGACYFDPPKTPHSYFFSKYPQVWGWAGWAKSWERNKVDLGTFDQEFPNLSGLFQGSEERAYWERIIERVLDGRIASWDYFWAMAIWRSGGVAINPTSNLVRNLGFSSDATNTSLWKDYRGLRKRESVPIGCLNHPPAVEIDDRLDYQLFLDCYRKPPLLRRLIGSVGVMLEAQLKRVSSGIGCGRQRDPSTGRLRGGA
jgi:hypothetical protein